MTGSLIVGVDAGCASLHDADLLIHRLVELLDLPGDTVACTHLVDAHRVHVALSFALPPTWREPGSWRRVAHLAGELAIVELAAARRAAAAALVGADPVGGHPIGGHLVAGHLVGGLDSAGAPGAVAGPMVEFLGIGALVSGPVGLACGAERIGPPELADGAAQAVADHAGRQGGRAVVYPGVGRLRGTVLVETVLGQTAVGRVVVPTGQAEPRRSDLLRTRNHVRPVWRDGVLTLVAAAERGRVFTPSEVPHPTPVGGR
ncbi:hypothetical protein FF36_02180 [Frankia torreyi]|uniref:Uncharacterized protein n=1 Tax=Frankia torreyi TaxID=1856 RepID=A0A0D8BHK6_9ACTN|nr:MULTISPECIES: hypothetical protein [Frankia]KJE23474.1 hypothetical protein FF36_02180 [Frankia torreyi]KQM05524.1 hypothetical protein FF86_101570 [Frankia sp. CpI1-P]